MAGAEAWEGRSFPGSAQRAGLPHPASQRSVQPRGGYTHLSHPRGPPPHPNLAPASSSKSSHAPPGRSAASGLPFTARPLRTPAQGSCCGPISKMGKRRPRRPSLPLVRGESKVCLAAQPDRRDARETVDPLPSPVRGSPWRRAGQLAPRDLIHYPGSALCPEAPQKCGLLSPDGSHLGRGGTPE